MSPLLVLPEFVPGIGSGDPGGPIRITDPQSFPTGIETPLEYNGLLFNVRTYVDRIPVYKIDGIGDADIRDSRDVNPTSDGETPGASLYGGRPMVLTGRVESMTLYKLREMQQALKEAFADLSTERPLIWRIGRNFPGGPLRDAQIYCKKVAPISWSEEQNDYRFFRDFMITLRASNPRFVSYLPELFQHIFTTSGPVPGAIIASLENRGNYFAQPIITLAGPMTSPLVTNTTTGEFFQINTTIPSGDAFTVDIAAKTIVDSTGENQFKTLTVASDMWELSPGVTPVQFSAVSASAGSQISLKYRHTWL